MHSCFKSWFKPAHCAVNAHRPETKEDKPMDTGLNIMFRAP